MNHALSRACLQALLLCVPAVSTAQVYKCVDKQGQVEFSDQPCGLPAHMETLKPKGNTLDTSGAREQALKHEIDVLKQKLQAQQGSGVAAPRSDPDIGIDSQACESAKRELDVVTGTIGASPDRIAARRSLMYGACGLREPDITVVQPLVLPLARPRLHSQPMHQLPDGTPPPLSLTSPKRPCLTPNDKLCVPPSSSGSR